MKSPPGLSCVVCSTCGHCSTSPWVGSSPKHPGGVKLSWIIQLRNGFEVKGHLHQEMVVCGCHHLEKGPFRGAGEAGGCAVGFPVVDCLLLNSTLQTPGHTAFSSARVEVLGLGVHRRAQPVLEQEGAGHPAGLCGECGDVWVPQCPGTPQGWNCLSPCDGGTSSRISEDAGGSGSAVGWAVPGGHCSHCPVLPAAQQG